MPRIEDILDAACAVVKLRRQHVELSVNVVSPAVMRRLNRTYRSKDKTTDVLSFPLLKKHEVSTARKKRDILVLGDIFIGRSFAKKETMFAFLIVHGFLHLLGYDHEQSEREARVMFALQDTILSQLGYAPPNDLRH